MPYGCGDYVYDLVEYWAKCPAGFTFNDVPGVAVDAADRVYVFNRGGAHPVMVFDREGNFIKAWGENCFDSEHGVGLAENGTVVYLTDGINHTVSKFTSDGQLLKVLGKKTSLQTPVMCLKACSRLR